MTARMPYNKSEKVLHKWSICQMQSCLSRKASNEQFCLSSIDACFLSQETSVTKVKLNSVQNGLSSSLITFYFNLTYFSGIFRLSEIVHDGQQSTVAATVAASADLFVCPWLLADYIMMSQPIHSHISCCPGDDCSDWEFPLLVYMQAFGCIIT